MKPIYARYIYWTLVVSTLIFSAQSTENSSAFIQLEGEAAQAQIASTLATITDSDSQALAQQILRDCSFNVLQIIPGLTTPVNVTTSGLYCLGGNFSPSSATGGTAIKIGVNNVIIDLNGFTIQGNGGSSTAGVYNGGYSGVMVMNGSIAFMSSAALYFTTGISQIPTLFSFNNLLLNGNATGINLQYSNIFTIQNCLATNFNTSTSTNTNTRGFYLQQNLNGLIKSCSALYNGVGFVLNSNASLVFQDCFANYNLSQGFNHNGGTMDRFINCIANGNLTGFSITNAAPPATGANTFSSDVTLLGCEASNNNGNGFLVNGSQETVQSCQANDNGINGFVFYGANHIVLDNRAVGNNLTGFLFSAANTAPVTGSSGLPTASNCQIRNNTAIFNTNGFSNLSTASTTNHFYSNFANNNFSGKTQHNFINISNVATSPLATDAINFTANISE